MNNLPKNVKWADMGLGNRIRELTHQAEQIEKKMEEPEGYVTDYNGSAFPCYGVYERDCSAYKVECYPVNKPVAIRNLCLG